VRCFGKHSPQRHPTFNTTTETLAEAAGYNPQPSTFKKMPARIQYLDDIQKEKKRPVLFLQFMPDAHRHTRLRQGRKSPARAAIIEFLEAENIPYAPCLPGSSESSGLISGYYGDLYIDIPHDTNDPTYMHLQNFIENEDGKCKFPETKFWLIGYKDEG
jgi:hypothetical protein